MSVFRIGNMTVIYAPALCTSLEAQDVVRAAVRNGGYRLDVLIHPNYSQSAFPLDKWGREVRSSVAVDYAAKYPDFQTRLGDRLKYPDTAVAVFTDQPEQTAAWIESLDPKGVFIFTPTPHRNPQPILSEDDQKQNTWEHFAEIFKALGVRRIDLIGEVAYELDMQKKGCVYFALAHLSDHFYVRTVTEYCYPNSKTFTSARFSTLLHMLWEDIKLWATVRFYRLASKTSSKH